MEDRWQIAAKIFPDLNDLRRKLAQTAHRLAFAFVTQMLESKKFDQRKSIAADMEFAFLARHFGTNTQVIDFAKELILLGNREAIKALNKYVEVLGSNIDPAPIISAIRQEFDVSRNIDEFFVGGDVVSLKTLVKKTRSPLDAIKLLRVLGYCVECPRLSEQQKYVYIVCDKTTNLVICKFTSDLEFINWVIKTQ